MIKRLLSDSVVYGLSSIMARVAGFLLLPVYSQILVPGDYGILGLYNSTFFLTLVVIVFCMDNATYRFYFDSTTVTHQRYTTATWIWFQLVLSSILLLLAFFFSEPIGKFLFKIPEGYRIVQYMAVSITLYTLPNIQEVWFRIKKKPWGAFSFALVTTIINIALTYYFIVFERTGFWGFIKAQVVSYGIGTLISLYLLRHHLLPRYFNPKLLRQMIQYAFPLVPAMALNIGIPWICYFVLSRQHDYTETGLYNMGNTFASILTLITNSFAQAYLPFAFSIMNKEEAPQIYSRVFILYIAGLSLLTFGYGLFSLDVLKIITRPQYYGSWFVMVILAYHYFILSTTTLANIGAGIQKNAKPFSVSFIIAAAVSIALFFILIPFWGKEGAAVGLLIGQLCVPIISFHYSQRMYPIPYDFKTGIGIIISSVLCSLAVQGIPQIESFVLSILLKGCLFLLYGAGLFLLVRRKIFPGRFAKASSYQTII